jgi:copper chaperone CopZ
MPTVTPLLRGHSLVGSTIAAVAATVCGLLSVALIVLERNFVLGTLEVEEWRPSLLVWGLGLLVLAWALRYQWTKNGPGREATSARPTSLNSSRVVLWLASTAMVLSLTFPLIREKLEPSEPNWPAVAPANALAVKIKIPSMDCASCARSVNLLLGKQSGVEKAEFRLEGNEAIVWYSPSKTSKSGLIAEIRNHGFNAQEAE